LYWNLYFLFEFVLVQINGSAHQCTYCFSSSSITMFNFNIYSNMYAIMKWCMATSMWIFCIIYSTIKILQKNNFVKLWINIERISGVLLKSRAITSESLKLLIFIFSHQIKMNWTGVFDFNWIQIYSLSISIITLNELLT